MQNLVLIPIGTMTQNVADFLSLSLPEILNAPCNVLEEEIVFDLEAPLSFPSAPREDDDILEPDWSQVLKN